MCSSCSQLPWGSGFRKCPCVATCMCSSCLQLPWGSGFRKRTHTIIGTHQLCTQRPGTAPSKAHGSTPSSHHNTSYNVQTSATSRQQHVVACFMTHAAALSQRVATCSAPKCTSLGFHPTIPVGAPVGCHCSASSCAQSTVSLLKHGTTYAIDPVQSWYHHM